MTVFASTHCSSEFPASLIQATSLHYISLTSVCFTPFYSYESKSLLTSGITDCKIRFVSKYFEAENAESNFLQMCKARKVKIIPIA